MRLLLLLAAACSGNSDIAWTGEGAPAEPWSTAPSSAPVDLLRTSAQLGQQALEAAYTAEQDQVAIKQALENQRLQSLESRVSMLQQQVVSAEEGRALAEKAFKQASSERAALGQQAAASAIALRQRASAEQAALTRRAEAAEKRASEAERGLSKASALRRQADEDRAALEQRVGQAQWSQSRAEEQVQSLRQQLATVLEDHKVAETGRMQAEEEVGRLHKELLAWSKRDAAAERSLLQMQVQLRNTGLHMASTQFALQQQAEVARQLRANSALQMRSFGQQLAMVSGVIQSSGEQLLGASGAGSSSSAPFPR